MLLRLVRPMKRKGVSQLYFVQRIPADVKSSLVGKALLFPVGDSLTRVEITNKTVSVRLSLRTNNESEGKIRQAAVAAHLEWVWRSLRERPRSLTQKEATALAGEVYKQFTSALEDDPGEAEQWRRVQKDNLSAFAGDFGGSSLLIGDEARKAAALAERFGPFVDLVLARKAIRVDEASRGKLLQQIARAMHEASVTLTRNADGDYRPDDNAARFPQWDNKASGACPVSAQGVTLDTLLEGWSREARAAGKASVSTADGYSRSIRVLVKFLGHDDPARVTPENVVAFKDARLAEINP